jgi:hypothetical protein
VPPDWPKKKAQPEKIVESVAYSVMKGGECADSSL